jgi:hypothetical protein
MISNFEIVSDFDIRISGSDKIEREEKAMVSSSPVASDIMRELSTYIAKAHKKPIPKDVAEVAKHHLLDARRLIDTVWRIEKVADTRALRPLLRA